jgi:DNA repair protein RecN (Recombination protein N)
VDQQSVPRSFLTATHMLMSLTVRDIVLIETAELDFAPGLNVLTGETGAGKTILLDALGLAAGGRAGSRASVRPGAGQGGSAAIFETAKSHPIHGLLADSGFEVEDELVLRRTIMADGRTRGFINDQPAGVALLREVGAALLEVHGQADDRGLFDVSTHRQLLDTYGGHAGLAEEMAVRYAELTAAKARRDTIKGAAASAASEIDYLSNAIQELSLLEPHPGEEARLASERALLMNAARIAEDVSAAADLMTGERGAETNMAQALRKLSRLAPEGRAAARASEAALEAALALVQEVGGELQSLLARLEADPAKLEQSEERLFALRAAARKYGVPSDGLAALQGEFETKLAVLDQDGSKLAEAEKELLQARATYLETGRKLSAARAAAAKRLEATVARELAPLKLGHARFRVGLAALSEDEAGANGLERVGFEVATIEGAPFGPLTRIASGGELARFALALKVALAEASPPTVLVFDEVDRGVGGAVAGAVGERLQKLARTAQVLLVTHSPQVAARAARHFRIVRKGDAVRVELLDAGSRVEEIARMLSGVAVTDEARAAARSLIAEAQNESAAPTRKRARA